MKKLSKEQLMQVVRQRKTKGAAFMNFPCDADADYKAMQARVAQELENDWKVLGADGFKAKHKIYIY